jgi:hypothetical protein
MILATSPLKRGIGQWSSSRRSQSDHESLLVFGRERTSPVLLCSIPQKFKPPLFDWGSGHQIYVIPYYCTVFEVLK